MRLIVMAVIGMGVMSLLLAYALADVQRMGSKSHKKVEIEFVSHEEKKPLAARGALLDVLSSEQKRAAPVRKSSARPRRPDFHVCALGLRVLPLVPSLVSLGLVREPL